MHTSSGELYYFTRINNKHKTVYIIHLDKGKIYFNRKYILINAFLHYAKTRTKVITKL